MANCPCTLTNQSSQFFSQFYFRTIPYRLRGKFRAALGAAPQAIFIDGQFGFVFNFGQFTFRSPTEIAEFFFVHMLILTTKKNFVIFVSFVVQLVLFFSIFFCKYSGHCVISSDG